jgi:hypothetical protein
MSLLGRKLVMHKSLCIINAKLKIDREEVSIPLIGV